MPQGSLSWRIDWIKKNPNGVIVGGLPAGLLNEEGHIVKDLSNFPLPVSTLTLDYYQGGGHYPVANWLYLYRRDFIANLGYFDETLRIGYDFDFILKVFQETEIPLIAKPTVLRRFHRNNISVHEKRGRLQLRPEVISACKGILKNRNLKIPSEWAPWEVNFGAN